MSLVKDLNKSYNTFKAVLPLEDQCKSGIKIGERLKPNMI